jgi:hypothetical protein
MGQRRASQGDGKDDHLPQRHGNQIFVTYLAGLQDISINPG